MRYFASTTLAPLLFLLATTIAASADDNSLSYLDSNEVWFPHKNFPKLITPQWVGEEGVECVVVLAIDDMREPAKYESYLRPILQRLKAIDGRAPVSIMTCAVKPDDPQLQTWLHEGLSLECHTFDHPCPLLAGPSIVKPKATYDKCVDLLSLVPNNKPVAFRTPCCDSLNTLSPRFFSEIFNKRTDAGNFLQLDSSVFTLYTADDPSLPREMLLDADGREKFRKYIPRQLKRGNQIHDGFVNLIENFPYPYAIQNVCWEFPCMVPSDWSANHLHQPNNPDTVRDLKVALDLTVMKQGVMNLVFHPHGWIKAEQIVELIDHAVAKHGNKVKFLNFKECVDHLNRNVLQGHSLRDAQGSDNGVRMVDISGDGLMDVVISKDDLNVTRAWSSKQAKWVAVNGPLRANHVGAARRHIADNLIFWTPTNVVGRYPSGPANLWTWNDLNHSWQQIEMFDLGLSKAVQEAFPNRLDGFRWMSVRNIDNDEMPEVLLQPMVGASQAVASTFFNKSAGNDLCKAFDWFPTGITFRDENDLDNGLRFVDLNDDGCLDIVYSNHERYGAWLFESKAAGWSIELFNTKRDKGKADVELPPIVLEDGSDNGFFVKDRDLCWINESTADLPDLIVRVAFNQVLGDRMPEAKSPKAAIKSMRVQPGFEIELVAHEPLTMDPVAFDWGPDGKLWIAEMADYPNGLDGNGAPGGRIRFLEDTDRDGKYDKSTLFLDKVSFPNGVIAWKKGCLISAAPDLIYAEDTDGDGKADRQEVLYTGFAEGNQQHRVNGFTRGLDNWLYLANGDSGGGIKSTKTGETLELRGRDLRIRPDTGAMEAIAGQTQFARNRDDWGNWFGNNNSRPMWHYVLDDHYLRRNPNLAAPGSQHDVSVTPGAAPVFPSSKTLTRFNDFHTANRFTSACSAMVYRDNLLFGMNHTLPRSKDVPSVPSPTTGAPNVSASDAPETQTVVSHVFVSEPVHNLVHHEVMTATGLTFKSQRAINEQQSEFVSSTDNWFRPTMVRTGPDGGLWIADMYRLVIEHPQWIPIEWQRKLNVRAGEDKGRIWRVIPIGTSPPIIHRFDQMTTPELVAALDSSNGCQRDLVQQTLIDQADPAAIPLLRTQATAGKNPLCRLHSLCTLDGFTNGLTHELIVAALQDSHPGIRRHAIRLAESQSDVSAKLIDTLAALVSDSDDQVLLQLAYTLGELKHPRAGQLLGQIARQSNDGDITVAVLSSLNANNLTDVLAEILKAGAEKTELLQQMLSQAVALKNQSALVTLLTSATKPQGDAKYAGWQYSAIEQLMAAIARGGDSLEHWLSKLGSEAKPLANRLRLVIDSARKLATDDSASIADRVSALRVLGDADSNKADMTTLCELLSPQHPPELQSAALGPISRMTSREIATTLLAKYRSLAPDLREQTVAVLVGRDTWRDQLLTAIESRQLSPSDINATTWQKLLADKSKAVRDRAARVLSIDPNTDKAKLIAEYVPQLRAESDAQHGSQLFKKMCSQCHKLGDIGHDVGPNLAAMKDKSAEALLTAVLDPNRAVETRYLTFTAITKQGVTHTGIIASESANSLTLRGSEAKEVTLLRNELDEFQSTAKSLMPEGLERDLKPNDAAALIAYIRRNVPLPALKRFPKNEPRVVQPDAKGALTLTPFEAEIYGSTIIIEEQHQNLGWWSSEDDVVVWTVNVPQTGFYSVEWTWACDAQAAGNRVTVEARGKSFTREVKKTKGWDDYQTGKLGELALPQGEVRLTVKPASRPLPALGDVKSIVLRFSHAAH